MPVRRPSPGESHIIGSATHPAGVKMRGSACRAGNACTHVECAASGALVSRSRAMPAGEGRPVLPVGAQLSRAILLLTGPRREGSHPDGWGLRRRGPAGRCAGPHRRYGVPLRPAPSGMGFPRGAAFSQPVRGGPLPARHAAAAAPPAARAALRGFARRRRAKPGQATALLPFPPPRPPPRAGAADPA